MANIITLIPKPLLMLGSIGIGIDLVFGGHAIKGIANTQTGAKAIAILGAYAFYESGLLSSMIKHSFSPSHIPAQHTETPKTSDAILSECFKNLPPECSGLSDMTTISALKACCADYYHD